MNTCRLAEIHNAVHFRRTARHCSITTMNERTLDDEVATVVKRLGTAVELPDDRLELEVRATFADWDDAKVREFVPIFVERSLRGKLGLSGS